MSKKLTGIGIAITVAYLIAAALLGWGQWDQFSAMKPNEVGDFLAGVVGPLALLWLILGYFQQGEELRHSAAALRLQADELRASVEQQRDLVMVSRAQLDAERAQREDEKLQRKRAMRPRFALVTSGVQLEGGREIHGLILKNAGGAAFSASGHIQRAGKHLQGFNWSYIGPHQECALHVAVPIHCRDKFRINVRSADAEGDVELAIFEVDVKPFSESSASTKAFIRELASSACEHDDYQCEDH